MYNICRPFILYNDFLPPSKEAHDWQYLSLGYYDGIDVGDNLFNNESTKTVDLGLEKLWNYYVKRNEKLNGSFSEQIIFGLRTEGHYSAIKDKEFWSEKNRTRFPFIFVTLVQAEYEQAEELSREIEELEAYFTTNSRKVITYFTFDTSDLLMVIACKEYNEGIEVIENLHQELNNKLEKFLKWKLTYSFSIAAIRKGVINNKHNTKKITGIIPQVDIYLIEKKLGAINGIYEIIEKSVSEIDGIEIERESVLGCNDEVIKLKNIPWSRFLLFYRDGEGIFNNSSEEYHNGVIGITTIVGAKKVRGSKIDIQGTENRNALLSKTMRQKCVNLKFGKKGQKIDISGIKRNMYQVINSLQKFEETPLRDYLFQTALLPLNTILDMAEEVSSEEERRIFSNSFYVFMKEFNLYVQDSGRSDRQFTQMPDFNAKIYDTPVKINAFYNAFIFNMKEYLNDLSQEVKPDTKMSSNEYEFLACPGVADNMQVRECFVGISKSKRLFLVEIPEKQVYKPKQMLIMLAHEVAHFVGRDIRNRKERFECIKDIGVEIIVQCLQLKIKEIIKENYEKNYEKIYKEISKEGFWRVFKEEIYKKINLDEEGYRNYYLSKFEGKGKTGKLSKEERSILLKMWEYRKYHSEVVVNILGDLITDKLCEEGEELWAYIIERYYLILVEHDVCEAKQKRDRLRVELNQYVAQISSIPIWNLEMLTIKTAMDAAMGVFKECIADLVCILTLELNLEDYLNTIISSANDQGVVVDKDESILILRIMLVVECMEQETCEGDSVWGEEQLEFFEEAGKEEISDLWVSVHDLKSDYLGEKRNIIQSQITEEGKKEFLKAVDALYNYDILRIFHRYLCKCKRDFMRYSKRTKNYAERAKKRSELREAYELFNETEIEKILFKMNKLTDDYLKKIQELNKVAAGGEESGRK